MTTSHTHGPWLITNSHIENGEWVTGISSEKEDGTIALVVGSKARPGYVDESPVSGPNAHLIAAAPELLEACLEAQKLQTLHADNLTIHERNVVDTLHAAIAKAKGE